MRVDECEAWITCDGERLPEYDTQPEGDDGKTFACFIPSEAGKQFTLGWQNHSADDCLRFTAKLDGNDVKGKWYRPQGKGALAGMHISATMLQPFHFSPLELTDADDALRAPANTDLGTIRVRVERVKAISRLDSDLRDYPLAFQSTGPVHERSKKLGAHCVKPGEATEAKSCSLWRLKTVEPEKGPLVEFLFRYRPLALLQAQDIAPLPLRPSGRTHRSPTGQDNHDDDARPAKRQRVGIASGSDSGVDLKPDISNPSDDDGDEDELGMLKGQLSQIMDRITQMEQKKKQRKGGGSFPVKKEEPVASSSRLRASSGDVIDLTLSD